MTPTMAQSPRFSLRAWFADNTDCTVHGEGMLSQTKLLDAARGLPARLADAILHPTMLQQRYICDKRLTYVDQAGHYGRILRFEARR